MGEYKRRSLLLATTALCGIFPSALLAQPALDPAPSIVIGTSQTPASSSNETVEAPRDAAELSSQSDPIIVTGSRIQRPNLNASAPITSVQGEEFFATSQVNIGDVLNEQPSLRSTFSSSNSTRGIGFGGFNFLDLRGLGTSRTLVLVNGRRHVPSIEGFSEIDVNSIPQDLIERVDIVTGGNSAIYGSDAIAGVVNFILKNDFMGLQLRGQGGISTYGDGGAYFAGITAGTNFSDGRGNIAVAAEYSKQSAFFDFGRPTTRNQNAFVVVDSDPSDTINGSDGNPDRIFVTNITSLTTSPGGTVQNCPNNLATTSPLFSARCLLNPRRSRSFLFLPDGTLVEDTYGARDFRPLQAVAAGGSGNTGRGFITLQPNIERMIVNAVGHFDVSDALKPFFEAKFARTETTGNQTGPAVAFGGVYTFRFDNPFLTDQARTQLRRMFGAAATTFNMQRFNIDFGPRTDFSTRDTWRVVGGVRGTFNEDWNYEISANYGTFKKHLTRLNTINLQRLAFAMDAVRDPATGNIVCRVAIDPRARVPSGVPAEATEAQIAGFQARLAGDVAACVPINMFGRGRPSQAALDYVLFGATAEGKASQFVLNGFVSGDLSQWFELPGGPIGFAVGAEYRRETASEAFEEIIRLNGTSSNVIPPFNPPAFGVTEAFAELRFPILSDVPGFHELTAELAGRVAKYKGQDKEVYAYNAGLIWSPLEDVRLRAGYSRAVRAANLGEKFLAGEQAFVDITDPCDVNEIGAGSATRAANCSAAGIPAGFANEAARRARTQVLVTGNPALEPETSDSITVGAVLQPRFVPGLSLSVDYYDIKVKKVISFLSAQQIVNGCYDAPNLENQFCDLFSRQGAGAIDPLTGDSAQFFFVPGIRETNVNFAALRARGIDAELAYRHRIEGLGTLNARLQTTYVLQRDDFPFLDFPDRADQRLYEVGDPKWEASLHLDLKHENVTFGYQLRYIGKQLILGNTAENVFSVNGEPPQNADFAERNFYPEVFYHDLRIGVDATDKFNFYVGVDNAFNRLPPLGVTAVQEGTGIFDIRGRFFYAGAVAKF
jgi:outer membrane receptor protein involved in Fe transport